MTYKRLKKKLALIMTLALLVTSMPYQSTYGDTVNSALLNNGKLRFGKDVATTSISEYGSLEAPRYLNDSNLWKDLTLSQRRLGFLVEAGGDGTNTWNSNGDMAYADDSTSTLSITDLVVNTDNYDAVTQTGVVETTANALVGGKAIQISNEYTLLPNKSYLKVKTKITNVSGSDMTNVRYIAYTRDDYIDNTDSPNKAKGNIENGVFVQAPTNDTQSKALKIYGGAASVILFSPEARANVVISNRNATSLIATDPVTVDTSYIGTDQAYGMFFRLDDLANNDSDEITWYYAAGAIDDIADIVSDLDNTDEARLDDLTIQNGTLSPSFTIEGAAYSTVLPVGTTTAIITITASGSTTINGSAVANNSATTVSVTPGHNPVRVEVTNGSDVKIVDLDIVVASNLLSNLTLDTGTLSPAFDPDTTAYTVNYGSGTTGTTVTATTLTTGAFVTVNAIATSSAVITLSAGVNIIDVVVTAEDLTSKTYTITATVADPPTDPLIIASVQGVNDITVPYGTDQNSINFPQTVNVVLSDSSTTSSNVVWSSSTPVYNSTSSGIYVFSGDLTPPTGTTNANNIKASVNVIVSPNTATNNSDDDDDNGNSSISQPENVSTANTIVKVNGAAQNLGVEKNLGNGTVEITLDSKILENLINVSNANTQNSLEITVQDQNADTANLVLTGDIIKNLEQSQFDLVIKKKNIAYKIPAKEFTIDSIADKLKVDSSQLKSIEFEIQIKTLTDDAQTALMNNLTTKLILNPTEFNITAKVTKSDGTEESIVISNFSDFVERTFELPSDVKSSDVTTGIVFNSDGSFNHVPTNILTENGRIYSVINSLTNSAYSVIFNPIDVSSVKGHWSEIYVNNLASRLVISDYKNFNPDTNVTRGELSEYIVKALGLYRNNTVITSKFNDVSATDPHAIAITVANNWGIIDGYSDGTFKQNDFVTREEAMVMYSKAMDLANYSPEVNVHAINLLNNNTIPTLSSAFVKHVVEGGVFNGKPNNNLDLNDSITHAECIAALHNLLINSGLINEN